MQGDAALGEIFACQKTACLERKFTSLELRRVVHTRGGCQSCPDTMNNRLDLCIHIQAIGMRNSSAEFRTQASSRALFVLAHETD